MHPCKRTSVYRLLSRPDTSDNFLPTYNFSVAGGAQDCGNGRLDSRQMGAAHLVRPMLCGSSCSTWQAAEADFGRALLLCRGPR